MQRSISRNHAYVLPALCHQLRLWPTTVVRFLLLLLLCKTEAQASDSLSRKAAAQERVIEQIHEGTKFFKDNRDTALTLFLHAYDQSRDIAYYDGIFHAAISIAMVHAEFGRYTEALSWFHVALNCTPNTSRFFRNSSRVLHNIGTVYRYQGQYREAVEFYFKAAQMAGRQAARDPEVADHLVRIYTNIGEALLQTGDYTRSLYYLEKAGGLAAQLHLPERMAHVLNNKAKAAYANGDREQAWKYIHQALALAKRAGPSRVTYTASQTIAEMLNNEGDPEKAIPYLKSALKSMAEVNPYYRSGILYTLGNSYFLLKDYGEARYWLEAAFREATASVSTEYILRSHQRLATLYATTRDFEQAYLHQQSAYLINDSLLNRGKTVAVNLMEVKYRTAEKDKELIRKQLLISEQQYYLKQKNIWIYCIACGMLLLTLLAFSYYRTSRHKQKIGLLKAMIEGEERESTRIGQELHDGIGGRLVAINMNFGAVQKQYEHLEGSEELEQIMKMLDGTTEEVRKTAHRLIPDILSRYSFPEAIRLYCEQVSTEDLSIQAEIQEPFPELPGKTIELSLYRIIQELIQNIVKHAGATQAVIDIRRHEKELNIVVEDNGRGFDISAERTGIGLHNIHSRVKLLQGNITIDSAKEIGTSVSITFDITRLKTILSYEYKDRHY